MQRSQTNHCRVYGKVGDVTASSSNNGTANSPVFDTAECDAPSLLIDIASLGNNKKIALQLQESDEQASGFVDVVNEANRTKKTNVDPAVEFDAAGLAQYDSEDKDGSKSNPYYIGIKRYIRVKVISKSATPASTVRVYSEKDEIYSKPGNVGI